ncbi:uncharacterized protein PG986_004820 [Apiospora aurea]|uniref:Peptidase S54 rhomboid domain-containing protein n=1 Tax=Apiospora aurea TaxID=335848 RepID=A0ABR1QP27_9PEZI
MSSAHQPGSSKAALQSMLEGSAAEMDYGDMWYPKLLWAYFQGPRGGLGDFSIHQIWRNSAIICGIAAALACLYPRTRVLPFVPLWSVVLYMVGRDAIEQYRLDVRIHIRNALEMQLAGYQVSINVSHAAHLGGAAFGVFFALVCTYVKYRGNWEHRNNSRSREVGPLIPHPFLHTGPALTTAAGALVAVIM